MRDAYFSFPFKDEVSFSQFCIKINKTYKKPHRISDMCDHCEFGKKLKKEIIDASVEFNYINQDTKFDELNTQDLLNFFNSLKEVYRNK